MKKMRTSLFFHYLGIALVMISLIAALHMSASAAYAVDPYSVTFKQSGLEGGGGVVSGGTTIVNYGKNTGGSTPNAISYTQIGTSGSAGYSIGTSHNDNVYYQFTSIIDPVTGPAPTYGDGARYYTNTSGTYHVGYSSTTITGVYTTQYYLNVASAHGTTGGSGWYNSGSTRTGSVSPNPVSGGSGTQYLFTNWSGDATGTGTTSNGILMNGPKTAQANWKTQYYLTVTSSHDSPSGGGWKDANTNANASLSSGTVSGGSGTQYLFTNWSQDASGTGLTSNNIFMNGPKKAKANWTTQYYLTLDNGGHGTISGASSGWYNEDERVDFSISPTTIGTDITAARYQFDGWNGSGSGSDDTDGDHPSTHVHMYGPICETADWDKQYYLTVISPYDTPGGQGWHDANTNVHATLGTSTVSGGTGIQYKFTNWSGDASGTGTTSNNIYMNGPKTAQANWKTQYYLTVTSPHDSPSGGGWKDANTNANAHLGSGTVSGGSGTHYLFTGWSGDASGTGLTSNNIFMNSPKTAVANWKTQYYLEVDNGGHGSVSGEGWYDAGSPATFSISPTAVPDGVGTQYAFKHWDGENCGSYDGTDATHTITMNNHIEETAVWGKQYYLTVISPYGGPFLSGWYDEGEVVNFGVNQSLVNDGPGTRFVFLNWVGEQYGAEGGDDGDGCGDGCGWDWDWDWGWHNIGWWGWDHKDGGGCEGGDCGVNGNGSYTGTSPQATVTMCGPITETAFWKTQYFLTMLTNYGTVTPGDGWWDAGSVVNGTAISGGSPDWIWSGWTGTGTGSGWYTGSNNPMTVTMDSPITEEALWLFVPPEQATGILPTFTGLTITVDVLGNLQTYPVNYDGSLLQSFSQTSPDGSLTLEIPIGTTILNPDGTPAYLNKDPDLFTITAGTPAAPAGAKILRAYQLNPTGISFKNHNAILAASYNPNDAPKGTNLIWAFYDEKAQKWVDLETAGFIAGGQTVPNKLACNTSHFTYFAIIAK